MPLIGSIQRGAPDIPNLIEAFKRVAGQLKIELNEDKLERWISVFADTYFQETPLYSIEYKNVKENYLKKLISHLEKLRLIGIDVPATEQDRIEELENIFVMPDIQEEAHHRQNSKFSAKKLLAQSSSEKYFDKLVLLGEPGSGKSTLMQYFALKIAKRQFQELGLSAEIEWLPILIQIRELGKQSENYLFEHLHNSIAPKYSINIPNGFFDYWLKRGRVVILLDGLDEIADYNKRREIIQHIYTLFQQKSYADNKVIITSRPAGYERGYFQTKDFPHYYIQLFDDPKIHLFLDKWYANKIRFPDSQESETQKKNLITILQDKERIKLLVPQGGSHSFKSQKSKVLWNELFRDFKWLPYLRRAVLARNPFLLTIIALLHRYEGFRLPQRRHNLYKKAVETLLVNWEQSKFGDSQQSSPIAKLLYVKSEDLKPLMEMLAYWVHSQESTGNKDDSTLIDSELLMEQFSQDIKKLKGIELYQAKEEANKMIQHINNRVGLLNEQGQNCYAFVHKTFQEYLCAQRIAYVYEDNMDFEEVQKHLENYLYNPHWQEVLLLLIVELKEKPIAKALQVILNYNKDNKDNKELYYKNLLFAGNCLAEEPQFLKTGNDSPSQEILKALVELEVSLNSQADEQIRNQVFQTLCDLSQTKFAATALQFLEEKKDLIDNKRMEQYQQAFKKTN
ncbi:MAG: NACHT domain-containing protein [Iphinoe sp. HA4291-MV1]|jgi:predicted NACHT family NTPase|nr:NACHT domain-containing protein [Iphinoe sp. HA4291-MV1]